MKKIATIIDEIDDEIESAKTYAEKYLEKKAKNDETWSQRFKEMANDEVKHIVYLHDYATEEINALSEVYTPPVAMMEIWDKSHAKYVEKVAWLKQMLSM